MTEIRQQGGWVPQPREGYVKPSVAISISSSISVNFATASIFIFPVKSGHFSPEAALAGDH
jgi:hypothetical protein